MAVDVAGGNVAAPLIGDVNNATVGSYAVVVKDFAVIHPRVSGEYGCLCLAAYLAIRQKRPSPIPSDRLLKIGTRGEPLIKDNSPQKSYIQITLP